MNRKHGRNARVTPYRACTAQRVAAGRACQPRRSRKLLDPWLWEYVRTHLGHGCSLRQSAVRLRRAYPDDRRKHHLTEIIYTAWYVQRQKLLAALRQVRKEPLPPSLGTDRHGQPSHIMLITARPAEVAPGHW